MGVNIYYLEFIFILITIFQQQKLMKKVILTEIPFLRKKDKKHQKKLGCKFIRINKSNAKNGYDLDYEVGNKEAFIDAFKNKKTKELEDKIKEKDEKLNKKIKKKLETKLKELEDKNKSSITNQITNKKLLM